MKEWRLRAVNAEREAEEQKKRISELLEAPVVGAARASSAVQPQAVAGPLPWTRQTTDPGPQIRPMHVLPGVGGGGLTLKQRAIQMLTAPSPEGPIQPPMPTTLGPRPSRSLAPPPGLGGPLIVSLESEDGGAVADRGTEARGSESIDTR